MKPGRRVCAVLACALAAFGCGDGEGFEPDDLAADGAVVELPFEAHDAAITLADASDVPQAPDASQATADAAVVLADAGDAAAAPATVEPSAPPCFVALHRDADGDKFGELAETMLDCAADHTGYVADATDCYDGNKAAHPRIQPDIFFMAHRGDGSFDYNCDGLEELKETRIVVCPVFTEADSHCPPETVPSIQGDIGHNCYETQIRAKVDPALGGWSDVVPPCGGLGARDFLITWSRETSYQCTPPAAKFAIYTQQCR